MASKASNQSTLIRLCPEPKISYSDTDINGKDFLVHLTNNLNFALKECELFNTEVRNAINADIQSKIKCFSEGILMDTKKDFLDTSKSSRSENRIYDCTYFDRHNDDYIYNALQKDIGDKKKGDDSIIIQHTLGSPAEIIEIISLLSKSGILIIEDCALSIGSKINNKYFTK